MGGSFYGGGLRALSLTCCITKLPRPLSISRDQGLRHPWEQQGTGEQAFVIAVRAAVIVAALTRQNQQFDDVG